LWVPGCHLKPKSRVRSVKRRGGEAKRKQQPTRGHDLWGREIWKNPTTTFEPHNGPPTSGAGSSVWRMNSPVNKAGHPSKPATDGGTRALRVTGGHYYVVRKTGERNRPTEGKKITNWPWVQQKQYSTGPCAPERQL